MSFPTEPTHAATGATAERCPSCGARVRPGDEWCTLCHARVHEPEAGPDPEPEPELHPEPEPGPEPEPEPGPEPDPEPELPQHPAQPADHELRRAREAEVDAEAERMILELSATESPALPARLAALRPPGRGAGVVLATVGGLVMLGLIFTVMTVVGRFL